MNLKAPSFTEFGGKTERRSAEFEKAKRVIHGAWTNGVSGKWEVLAVYSTNLSILAKMDTTHVGAAEQPDKRG
ncbi:hypothetical protein PM082_014480 [Marasmius tenuissimus]|nr:hypothetical protein PM082_014480 [Marasmius tenuissimus]